MRIIGGEARGRKLQAPEGRGTRPLLDQIKQRAFDILGPMDDGLLVWDVFAGAGSFGLEALSRGAERAVFVDLDRSACAVVAKNLANLGWEGRGRVVQGDARRVADLTREDEKSPGIIFADPPFPGRGRPRGDRGPARGPARPATRGGGRLVFRVPSDLDWAGAEPHFWAGADRRRHGVNLLVVAAR
ncbi:MAG: RsmD family RNA methyltransferase [Planctomycetota bacterium]